MVDTVYRTRDGELFEDMNAAEEHENKLRKKNDEKFIHYTKTTYVGRNLLQRHSLDETGVWNVQGEDPNCDLDGRHYEPFLFMAEGTLRDVIYEAIQTSGFWTWGGGGRITKIDVRTLK